MKYSNITQAVFIRRPNRFIAEVEVNGVKEIFVIQMDGVSEVRPNIDTHPEFAVAMNDAQKAGVEILFLKCHVEPDSLEITC
ncbi:MAG: DNA/RNA nuclease SfsA [Eubacterium sp.]|nr:DNA/RNA nuclease SfsA [Eubacterium sp.]